MKYYITGATGFIGGKLTRKLIEQGHEIVALVRSKERAQDLKELGATLIEGDITDIESLRKSMPGVDGVFHVAAWYKVGVKNDKAYDINVNGTENVLEVMRELEIPKGVYTSTLAVNSDTHGELVDESYQFTGNHLSEYDKTKALAHQKAQEFIDAGLPLVIVMPGVVYGPGDTSQMGDVLRDFIHRDIPMVPQKTAYCWGHVDDIVDAHIAAMAKGRNGEAYIIAGPPHTFEEALDIAEAVSDIPAPKIKVAPGMLRFMSKLSAAVEPIIKLPQEYRAETLRVVAGVTYLGDNSKAKKELGYNPRPLSEGLKETLDALEREESLK